MTSWVRVAALSDLEEGVLGVIAGSTPIALYRVGAQMFATHDICTHGQASLSQGFLDGHAIECPLHQGQFDVRTGAAIGPPCTKAIKTYAVELRGDDIHVDLDS